MAGVSSRTRSRNVFLLGVSSRTRSKNVPLFSCVPLVGSSKRRKNVLNSVSGSKKRKVKEEEEEEPFVVPKNVEVISLDYDDGDEKGSEHCDERSVDFEKKVESDEIGEKDEREVKEESFVVPKNGEVISIDDDDKDEEGLLQCDEKMFEGCVDVEKEVQTEESGGGSDEIDAKDRNIVDDAEDVDGSDEDDSEEEDDDDDDESEENETSDEDFIVDEVNEISESDDESSSGSSSVDDDDAEEEEEEEAGEEEEEEEEEEEKKGRQKYFNVVEELAREANDKHSESSYVDVDDGEEEEEEEDKGEDLSKIWEEFSNGLLEMVREVEDQKCVNSETNNVEVNIENSPSSVCNDVSEHADHSNLITFEKKDYFDPVKGCSSSKGNGESKKRESKSLGIKMQNVSKKYDFQFVADQPISFVHSKVHKGESNNANAKAKSKDDAKVYENVNVNVGDSDEGKQKHVKGLGVGGVSSPQAKQEKMRDSDKPKMTENKGGDCKSRFRIRNGEKKESMDNNGLTKMFVPKELCLAKLLAECFWGNKNTMKKDSIVLEVKDGNDDWRDRDTRSPPVCVETPPQIWSLKKVEEVQKTKEELEQEPLWDQMDTALRESEAESMIGNLGTNDMRNPSTLCEHDTCFDDQIGVYCRWCGVVVTEIKYVSQLVMDRFPSEGSGKRASFDGSVNVSHFDGSQFNVSNGEPETNFSHNEGTVWDLIPDDVKETLYPHQLEGFEFIWKNLTGHIDLHKLSKTNPRREGGCIISHAPGTGKTRLTIMFLMSYLKVFPKCLPVIVAPASLLLTWEDEFKKWDIGVPFHNLNNLKLSGKEHDDAVDFVNWSNKRLSKDTTRMVKLISWYKEKSILGISYNLYEKLAGEGGSKRRKKRKHTNVEKRKQNGDMRNALLESPGLLVLDEGHIPRNERSLIWKVLSKIQTRKRIILSGTPFQNNFLELYNILSLVKPSFPNTIPHELKKFCLKQEYKKVSEEWSWEADYGNSTSNPSDHKIKQLKLLMDPFVHVHKGAILQKKLPGIRNCKLTLKPDSLQKQILDSIQSRQNALIYERKLTMASIHPTLFLECDLLKEEESVVNKDQLEKLRLNPYVGVKTKFLVEFVRLCDAVKEKVLVFSQLIRPLCLIIDQLSHISLNWTVGKEILFMHGEVSLKDRQSLIHSFNDANSQAKILLASTNACSEGISLVGASRVVLLDVVWNPSVDRQAISRAYRIGQKKVVYTYHLLTEGTAEKIKHRKQAEKHRLSELVFSAKNADKDKSKSCAVNFEDRILDQLKQHETFKDVFVTVQSKERDLVESFGS